MSLLETRAGIAGAQGLPPTMEEKGVVSPNSLVVRVATKIIELTSLCTYIQGREIKTEDGKHLYYELEKVDCHGNDRSCINYPSRRKETQGEQDPPPQQKDS